MQDVMEKTELKRIKEFDLPSGVLAAAASADGGQDGGGDLGIRQP